MTADRTQDINNFPLLPENGADIVVAGDSAQVAVAPRSIQIRYQSAQAKTALLALLSLSPVWAVWCTHVAWWLLNIAFTGGVLDYMDLVAVSLFYMFLVAAGFFGIYLCVANKFVLTERRIGFPLRYANLLLSGRNCDWSRLKLIRFEDFLGRPSKTPTHMAFAFQSRFTPLKESVTVELNGFEPAELKQILMAVEAYAPSVEYLPPKNQVDLQLPSWTGAPKTLTFTQLWEEDLGNRFGATAFVPLEPGMRLQSGRLTIVGQIAFGGLSAVYLARDKDENLVVLKEAVVPANADETSRHKALEMFDREAKLLIRLEHPRIAKVIDHFVEHGRHYIELEHIDGTDLRHFIKEGGPQAEAVVLRWTDEIAAIVQYLHSRTPPIIHRDITPDNIVLTADGKLTLIDFGAANEFLGTATGTLVGKQSYISPEQFRGKAQTSSDIYSVGCTVYFALTGQDPEPLAVSHPQRRVSEISKWCDELVARCTSQDAGERFPSADEVRAYIAENKGRNETQGAMP